MKHLCVFCGSSPGASVAYETAAKTLAVTLVDHNIGLVYGGASVGIMGTLADAVLLRGGQVLGVIPQTLVDLEVAHDGLTELKVVDNMHERKAVMADAADGFVALPGGLGTLEELFEVLTWSQLGFHQKPSGLLNVEGYYDGLLTFLEYAVSEQFVSPVQLGALHRDDDPSRLLAAMFDLSGRR